VAAGHGVQCAAAGGHFHCGYRGIIIAALGVTKVCIGGPTSAFIIIRQGIFAQDGAANLAICTITTGVILFLTGAASVISSLPVVRRIPSPSSMDCFGVLDRLEQRRIPAAAMPTGGLAMGRL